MAQFSPESWLNSNRNGGSRRSDRWLKIARNIQLLFYRAAIASPIHLIVATALLIQDAEEVRALRRRGEGTTLLLDTVVPVVEMGSRY